MTPEKILELLPKYKCEIIWNKEKIDQCETCSGCTNRIKREVVNDCANALEGKVVAKEDLLKFLKDGKDRCGCVNHCGCNEQDRIELFLKKANREKV